MQYIALILLVCAVYWKSLKFQHCVDDANAERKCGDYREELKKGFNPLYYALLLYGAGAFKNKVYDQALRIALTCAISCMLLWITGELWLASLWAIHPINNQLTLWLNGRRYQISLLLGLISFKFPLAGFVLFPMALYFHPIASPIIVITALFSTPLAILWAIPCALLVNRYKVWLKGRFELQPFEIYHKFNWGKPVLAVKCLAEYFRHGLFPSGFTMYHPEIWGLAELPGNRNRGYALNASFWLCIAFLVLIGYIGWFIGGLCLVGAIIGVLGVLPWLGIVVNPTQLWGQRYCALSSIGFIMFTIGVCQFFDGYTTTLLCMVFVGYLMITLKEMEMYRDFFSFFLMHLIQNPFNQNAHYFSATGMNAYAEAARKEGKPNDAALYASCALASSLMWCLRNKKPDLIHQFALQQLGGMKQKTPQKGGA